RNRGPRPRRGAAQCRERALPAHEAGPNGTPYPQGPRRARPGSSPEGAVGESRSAHTAEQFLRLFLVTRLVPDDVVQIDGQTEITVGLGLSAALHIPLDRLRLCLSYLLQHLARRRV